MDYSVDDLDEKPVTDKQRAYLIDLGVPKEQIPESRSAASALISELTSHPTPDQLAMLEKYLAPTEMPKKRDDASTTISAIVFVGACVRKKHGSSRCISNEDTWRIAKSLLEPIWALDARIAKLQAQADDIDTKLLDDGLSDAAREKLEDRSSKTEEKLYDLEEKREELADALEELEEDEIRDPHGNLVWKFVPATGLGITSKVSRQLKDCSILTPPPAPGAKGCSAMIAVALLPIAIVVGLLMARLV